MGDGRIILLWHVEHGDAVGTGFESELSKQRNRPAPTIMQAYTVHAEQIHTPNGDKAHPFHDKAMKATSDLNTQMINRASDGHWWIQASGTNHSTVRI